MKKHIILTYIVVSLCNIAIAQTLTPSNTCPPTTKTEAQQNEICEDGKGITTNPNNPVNPECSTLVNNFDWRVKHSPGGNVPVEYYYVYGPTPALNPRQIINPFNGPTDANYHPVVTANHGSNYQPTDAWELLKANGSIVFYEVHYFLSNPTTQTTKTLAL